MEASDSYRGVFLKTYHDSKEIKMLHGGLLMIDVSKKMDTKAYMINEDVLVRTGEIVD